MKNSIRVLTWLMVVAICSTCFIGTNLAVMDGRTSNIAHSILFFPGLIHRLILQAVAFGLITICLTISYSYFVDRSTNIARVRLVYAGIVLLVALSFVFEEYKYQQEKLLIRDVCIQFDLAVTGQDYETAYEFMSPNYQQTHSLAQFIAGEDRILTCGYSDTNDRVVLLHPIARNASVYLPSGSFGWEVFLEQVDDKWHLTGETRGFLD